MDPNACDQDFGQSALHKALQGGQTDVVRRSCQPSERRSESAAILRLVESGKCQLDLRDNTYSEATPLLLAAALQNKAAVGILLSAATFGNANPFIR